MYDMRVVDDEYVRHNFASTAGSTTVEPKEDLFILLLYRNIRQLSQSCFDINEKSWMLSFDFVVK